MTSVEQKITPAAQDVRACPVCNSNRTAFYTVKNNYAYLRCPDCDLVFIHPEPPQQALRPLYSEQGAPDKSQRYPYDKGAQRRRLAAARARRLAKYIDGKDAIDIGCGGGYVTDAMQRRGARAVGIDLDPEAINFCRANHHPQATFYCEPIDEFVKRGLTFDFGHSAQVIEHVGDFNGFVANWARLIRNGGYFFLKTPDRNHWRTGARPETWPDPLQYTQYFSRRNIRLLLEKHGFEIVSMNYKFKPTMEILARRK